MAYPLKLKALELLHRLKGKLEDGMITATARYAENSLVMSVSLHNSIDLPSFCILNLHASFNFLLLFKNVIIIVSDCLKHGLCK